MMDDAFEDDEVDAEADDITNNVLEEIGIDITSQVIQLFIYLFIIIIISFIYYYYYLLLFHYLLLLDGISSFKTTCCKGN